MTKDWNKEGFFSGITEDYSNYKWYKGESYNPFKDDTDRPLAAGFWEYEKDFHFTFLEMRDFDTPISKAYKEWKETLLNDHLPGVSPNPIGDPTDWNKSFETGKREHR